MARAQARIYRTANPAGWFYTFDRLDQSDSAIDNFATAANPSAALDALKLLVGAMPGTLASLTITIESPE